MKKKIIGILIATLFIATFSLPVIGTINVDNEISTSNVLLNTAWAPADATIDDTIYRNGNVGIGTKTPLGKLVIQDVIGNKVIVGGSDTIMEIQGTEGNSVVLGGIDTIMKIQDAEGNGVILGGIDTIMEIQGTEGNGVILGGIDTIMEIQGTEGNSVVLGGIDTIMEIRDAEGNGVILGGIDTFMKINAGEGTVASFSGRVKGADAVNNDEFVTKSQVESTIKARYTPSGTYDKDGNIGDYAYDDSYFYVKTNDGWKRAELETWNTDNNIIDKNNDNTYTNTLNIIIELLQNIIKK
jgi:hypothetical protein